MSTIIRVSTGSGATTVVGTSDGYRSTVRVITNATPRFTESTKTYVASASLVYTDALKLLYLDGTTEAVTLTINPAVITGLTVSIRCISDIYAVNVAQSSGNIELLNGANQTIVQLVKRQWIKLYSDGTKLIERP